MAMPPTRGMGAVWILRARGGRPSLSRARSSGPAALAGRILEKPAKTKTGSVYMRLVLEVGGRGELLLVYLARLNESHDLNHKHGPPVTTRCGSG